MEGAVHRYTVLELFMGTDSADLSPCQSLHKETVSRDFYFPLSLK